MREESNSPSGGSWNNTKQKTKHKKQNQNKQKKHSTSNIGKGIHTLRFGLNTFWLGFMHKKKQKHGEKEKNWSRSGK